MRTGSIGPIVGILLLLVAIQNAEGRRNRFNVVTYADYSQLANKDFYYSSLEDFGATALYSFHPDTVAYYHKSGAVT